ncbi:protein gp37 [Bacillus sp. SORGH_AS 510]|nr:protein gp37 [Bacillus sp. SORGH_AS_0510]
MEPFMPQLVYIEPKALDIPTRQRIKRKVYKNGIGDTRNYFP